MFADSNFWYALAPVASSNLAYTSTSVVGTGLDISAYTSSLSDEFSNTTGLVIYRASALPWVSKPSLVESLLTWF